MDVRVAPLAETLRLNTRLFRNCLDGLTDQQAQSRPSATTNSAAFVAAHLVESRFLLLKVLAAPRPSPLDRYLNGRSGIDDIRVWPTLAEIGSAWTEVSHALRDRIASMSAAGLDAPNPTRFPVSDMTVLGVVAFLVQHDSYHLGQLSLLRKYAGLPAMSYT